MPDQMPWRSPFGATEDRNEMGPDHAAAVEMWRSPFGATEDRNPFPR